MKLPTYEQVGRWQTGVNVASVVLLLAWGGNELVRHTTGAPPLGGFWGTLYALTPALVLVPMQVLAVVMLAWGERRFRASLAKLDMQAHLYAEARRALLAEKQCTRSSSSPWLQ